MGTPTDFRYGAAWDFTTIGTMTVSFTDAGGTFAVSVASGKYAHDDATSVSAMSTYNAFSGPFQTAVNAAKLGGSPSYTVTWSGTNLTYTITPASGTTALTFSGAAGTRAKHVLGFTGNVSATASAVSTCRPYYVIRPNIMGRSNPSGLYFDQYASEAVADDGSAFLIARTTPDYHEDWEQLAETEARIYSDYATTAIPWTWQHFFLHCGSGLPFYLVDDSFSPVRQNVYMLTADGARMRPMALSGDPNYRAFLNIALRTHSLGVFT